MCETSFVHFHTGCAKVYTYNHLCAVRMLRASDRKSQIRLFIGKFIHFFKMNAYFTANVDQIRNDTLIPVVFTNIQNQRAAKVNRGNIAFAEIEKIIYFLFFFF